MHAISRQAHTSDSGLRPARRAASVVAGLTLIAVAAALANGLPLPARILLVLLALGLGAVSLHRLIRPRWRSFRVSGRQVRVRMPNGTIEEGRLTGSPFVSPLFIGFRWRRSGSNIPTAVGVFGEQMDGDEFRRLRVALRQGEPR